MSKWDWLSPLPPDGLPNWHPVYPDFDPQKHVEPDHPHLTPKQVEQLERWVEKARLEREHRQRQIDAYRQLFNTPVRMVRIHTWPGRFPAPLQTAVGFLAETTLEDFLTAHRVCDPHLELQLHGEVRIVCPCPCGAFWRGAQLEVRHQGTAATGDVFQL